MELSRRFVPLVLISYIFSSFSPSSSVLCGKIHHGRGGFRVGKEIHVGVILDMGSLSGRVVHSCISMAISDFYSSNANYNSRLVLHTRDSKGDTLHALSQVFLLMKTVKLEAIVVADTSSIVEILAELGGKAQVPVISLSQAVPSLPLYKFPYLIQIKEDEDHQVTGIASIVEAFNWRNIILIYEDDDYGRGILSNMMTASQAMKIRISHTIAIPTSSTNEQVNEQLQKLRTLQTAVYVVHLSSSDLASRFFLNAKNHGLMAQGYAWITTSLITNSLSLMNSSVLEALQGVVGFKSYVHPSNQLHNFISRWRREFLIKNKDVEVHEPSIYGLWMYDTIRALALAAESMGTRHPEIHHEEAGVLSTELGSIVSSPSGFVFLNEILERKFKGMSGEFEISNGSLASRGFEIVNIMVNGGRRVGYWTPENGITREMGRVRSSASASELEVVVWPGGSVKVPKGWSMHGKKLRIGVPMVVGSHGFNQLISLSLDTSSNATIATGFCVDVFKAALETLDYEVPYEFIPFEVGLKAATYTDLIYQAFLQNFDAVVGDTTITFNRSKYVDFTVPYTDLGVGMIVRKSINNNMWVFLKPLTQDLWIITAAFFVFTGFVVWIIERPTNEEFQPISVIFWFSLSTLVFAHRERLVSNLSKFVVAVWVFVVLVLSSSYTATLASIFTVQQIHLPKGDSIGYYSAGSLSNANSSAFRLRQYTSLADIADALSRGSANGGVSAIVDEIPYLKIFLAHYSAGYTMVRQESTSGGFGFVSMVLLSHSLGLLQNWCMHQSTARLAEMSAYMSHKPNMMQVFSKGSTLVDSMSKAILKLREEKKLEMLENVWFSSGSEPNAGVQDSSATSSSSLNLANFGGLFLITGVASTSALIIFSTSCLYRKYHTMRDNHKLVLSARRSADFVKLHLIRMFSLKM